MVEVKQVSKSYGSLKAVDELSFSIQPGQIYGLLGPNGAGKSTTIRMIMNIISPDSGEILFDGTPINEGDKDRIGYLPEERGLYKKVVVEDLLLYLAELKGASLSKAKSDMVPLLKRFDLLDWKNKKTDELSKGMAQKIQFISTILHDPQIIVLDEPFSGLDPVSADQLSALIAELRDRGKTIIFSTHVMSHAEQICNRICIMKKGKVKTSGSLSEVKKQFGRNTVRIDFEGSAAFVKELPFVKDINLWPGSCEVELIEDDNASDKLFSAVAGKLKVARFKLQAPSLHKIFVDLAGDGDEYEKQ